MHSNNLPLVRFFNKATTITLTTLFASPLFAFLIVLDISAGSYYLHETFNSPALANTVNFTVPATNWDVSWTFAQIISVVLGAFMSIAQFSLWNLVKMDKPLRSLSRRHYFTLFGAMAFSVGDAVTDTGAATMWTSSSQDGNILPVAANFGQWAAVFAVFFVCTFYLPFMELFFGVDKPLFGASTISQKLSRRHSRSERRGLLGLRKKPGSSKLFDQDA